MLERFELPVLAGEPKAGRPVREASSHLRTLAWLRFLLEAMGDVEQWALAWGGRGTVSGSDENDSRSGVATPIPEGWKECPGDADLLAAFFDRGKRPPVNADPLLRTPTLLDKVFGPIFAGSEGSGGRYFSDRVRRGLRCPDPHRLARLDRLVPGSRRAFDVEPAGVDPWLYDAFDFSNPWYARLFLWRAMDPGFEDSGWDALVTPRSGGSMLISDTVRSRRHAEYEVRARDSGGFDGAIDTAAALAARPELAQKPAADVDEAVMDLRAAAAAASPEGHSTEHAAATAAVSPAQQWVSLSNAIAAHRVARLLELDTRFTRWWLQGVREGMGSASPVLERGMYYTKADARPAIDVALDAL